MDENPTYIVDFPPLPANPPRITPPSSTFAATPASILNGFGHPTAYDVFLAEEAIEAREGSMEADDVSITALPAIGPKPRLPEFLDLIGAATITTNSLLVSFIPDNIKPEAFIQLMESITQLLVSTTARQQARPPVYKRPGFLDFFTSKPPLWMIRYHAAEHHGSFILPLPIDLTFSTVGGPNGLQPPRFFTIPLHKRTCLVQAVPPDFMEVFRNSPELAFWRGFGADITAGHHYVLQAAIEAHTEETFQKCVASGELTSTARHFSYLSLHYVNIQEDTVIPKANKIKGKGPLPKASPTRHSWLECFIVTVSTVPVGRDSVVFQALLPPEAPFGTKLHPISLFGWRGEIASHLSLFRTWTYSPDPTLLTPQPTMRFMAIRPGYSLPSLCEGLTKDFQTLEGVFYCFIKRGNTDTFYLATDGRSLSLTPSLRAICYGGGMLDADLPGMAEQRNFYRCFNQVIAPSTSPKGNLSASHRPLAPARPPSRLASPALPYATVAQTPTQLESSLRSYAQQETRLVIHELSTTLAHEASSMVTNAVAPLKEELRKAHAEIETLKSELALQTATTKSTLTIVKHQSTTLQAQKDKDLEIQRLLYLTMQSAGLPLPDDADTVLAPPSKRRLSPTSESSPMESSDGSG